MSKISDWYSKKKYWQKLLFTYLIVAALPIVTIGISAYIFSGNMLKAQVVKANEDLSSKISFIINTKMNFYEGLIDKLVYDDELLKICSEEGMEYMDFISVDNYYKKIESQTQASNNEVISISIYSTYIQKPYKDFLKRFNQIYDEGFLFLAENVRHTVWVSQSGTLYATRSIYDPYTLKYFGVVTIEFDKTEFFREYTNLDFQEYGLIIIDNDGQSIYTKERLNEGIARIPTKILSESDEEIINYRSQKYILSAFKTPERNWTIYCYIPYNIISESVSRIITLTFVVITICFISLVIISVLISKKLGKRINVLALAMAKASTGKLSVDIPNGPPDEIGQLTVSFKDMISKIRNLINDIYESKLIQRDAEFKALQAQINPHFLYNSLNIINWRGILINDEKISRMATNLSDFYRTTLNKGKSRSPISDEIVNVKAYIDIQLEMHNENIDVVYEINEDTYSYETINLILQPIVENAFEHGIDKFPNLKGYLGLKIYRSDENIVFEVENSGVKITPETAFISLTKNSKGYGLSNVNNRIRLAYGEEYGVTLRASSIGTITQIVIPAIEYKEAKDDKK